MNDQGFAVPPEAVDDDDFSLNIWEWVRFFWMNRKFISIVTCAFTVLGVAVAMYLPKQYTASATILPPQTTDSKLASALSSLGGIAGDLAGAGESMSKIYPEIAKSRIVLSGLLDAEYQGRKFQEILQEEYRFEEDIREKLILSLQKNVIQASNAMKTNVVTVSVIYTDPEIAAAITNEITTQMEKFFKYQFRSAATSQRIMIETRLGEVADTLKIAEDKLLQFRESNRTTGLSPKLQVFEHRLAREVEINNALYVELNRQHEISKISELQLKPVLNILDKASPPIKKSKPSRAKILILFMILGFVVSVGYLKSYPIIKTEVISKLKEAKQL